MKTLTITKFENFPWGAWKPLMKDTISHGMANRLSQMATLLKRQSQHAMATMMETLLSTGTLAQSMSHVKL